MVDQGVSHGTWYEIGIWYDETIEEPVREVVKLLRNNGFNTIVSCGHTRTVEMEWYKDHEISVLWNLLWRHGYGHIIIDGHWETYPYHRRTLTLTLGSKQKEEQDAKTE